MNRETKIGLLVGLAFIIVVGILLSDYNRMENPPAALTAVGDNVRAGAATLHNGSSHDEVVPPPAPAMPSHPVLTREEVRGETSIAISPGVATPGVTRDPRTPRPVTPPISTDPTALRSSGPADTSDGGSILENLGAANGVEILPVPPRTAAPEQVTVNGAKPYVAVSGDTVSKLAGRFMGGNSKTNRDAIIAVNPTLKQNPNNVIVGRTYIIPSGKPTAGVPVAPVRAAAAAPAPIIAAPQYWYTVKDNDNLWKIAESQLGDGNAFAAIKDLNKDILKGGDTVHPNMRLRLPAKPIASTND